MVGDEPPQEVDLPNEGLQLLDVSRLDDLQYAFNPFGVYFDSLFRDDVA